MLTILHKIGIVLYIIIILAILIFGITGLSDILEYFNIKGIVNTILTYSLTIYSLSMFAYDINKQYKK